MNKYYIFLAFLLLGLSSCEKEEVIPTNTLTTQVDGSGSINQSDEDPMPGDTVLLTAIADEGYIFDGWTGDITSDENPLEVILKENLNITANFREITDADMIQLADNGVTLYCLPQAEIGKKYPYNGEMYEIVDSARLYTMAAYNEDVTHVITTFITDMNSLFDTKFINQDISTWDVSNVVDMQHMFFYAEFFNSDISNWDVSNVTNMESMFHHAESFNQDISKWDVSKVTNMQTMFGRAWSFNQDISEWDVSNVTDMSFMFGNAQKFNQDISGWDVSNVTDMSFMFSSAITFNQNLSSWNVSNVIWCLAFANGAYSWSKPKPYLRCAQQ
ncbi:BspA family leucine-rich repeat surface protein [Mangrovivirga cuniculi]|nr:BspA family leucine-rich repeat surface protein [Mangrovivirga cuniculi]